MSQTDQLHRYLFDQANVRGQLVQLEQSYQQVLTAHAYPAPIRTLLGELMAATSLLTATLKFAGDIALQLQGEGPISYVVVNGTDQQELRAVARWDEQLAELPSDFNQLLPKGVLIITITPEQGERYQGMVALEGDNLAACLEQYFQQSEQLPTFIKLAANEHQAGGLLLQVLPQASEVTEKEQLTEFEHLSKLSETLQNDELLDLPAEQVLYRLYHAEQVRLLNSTPVCFKCSCSAERSAQALANVDKSELLSIVAEQGDITMNCQYCHSEYRFDAIDVEAIHAGSYQAGASSINPAS